MPWQNTQDYLFTAGPYEMVAPAFEPWVIGDLQVVADTTDCQHSQTWYFITQAGGGDFTQSLQYFDETEQQWIDLAPSDQSCGGAGQAGGEEGSTWCPLPSGAVGPAVTFRLIGREGDAETTAILSNWRIRFRKQVV